MMRRSIQIQQTHSKRLTSHLSYRVPSVSHPVKAVAGTMNHSKSEYSTIAASRMISRPSSHQIMLSAVRMMSSTDKSGQPFTTNYAHFEFQTLSEMLEKSVQYHGSNKCFGTRKGDVYEYMSYNEFNDYVAKTRTLFAKYFSIGKEDKVSIISNNRWEWATVFYGAIGLGGQIVPMYEAQLEKDWKYVVNDSDSKVVIASTEAIYEQVKDYAGKVGKVQHVICLDASEDKPYSYKAWLKKVEGEAPTPITPVTSEDICTIIYTSGTTGTPKGVELVHRNICSNIIDGKSMLKDDIVKNNVSLSFLPWAHIYGQSTELHSLLSTGSTLAIVPHRDQILECLAIVKPTVIFSVPMLFNRVYDGVMKVMNTSSPIKRGLFNYAMSVARQRNHLLEFHQPVPAFLNWKFNLMDKIVLSKIRGRLGGNLQRCGAGGAATSPLVLQFFEDIGIPVMEGYGLTETSPVITAGSYDWSQRRLGTVGCPLNNVDVKIVDPDTLQPLPADTDGEITCTGPNVMKGYRNNQKANDEVFFQLDGKRYFRTGDMGRMVEGRFLKITGRIKEQFKLINGKFVVPAPLEDIFARGPFIAQSFIYGNNQQYTIALFVPNYLEISAWATKRSKADILALLPKDMKNLINIGKDPEEVKKLEELFRHPDFIRKVTKEIVGHSKNVKSYERPMAWAALTQPFTQENQQMTPKLSLRRNNVVKAYETLIADIYANKLGNKIEYPANSPSKE